VIPKILEQESPDSDVWLKSSEGLKFQRLFCKFPEKYWKTGFSGIIFGRKIRQLGPQGYGPRGDWSTVDWWSLPHVGARWSSASGRSIARELRPRGGGGVGRAGELNGGVTTGRGQWRGVSPAVLDSAMAVTVVELRSGGNERGRTPRWCEGGGVLGRLL
jgi:hypothetical protein